MPAEGLGRYETGGARGTRSSTAHPRCGWGERGAQHRAQGGLGMSAPPAPSRRQGCVQIPVAAS